MLKIFLLILFFIHGMIHILGFLKAFQLAEINQLTQNISKPIGIFWLIALILFFAAAIQLISNYNLWWITALAAVILSQVLIILFWQDAKFGTIANIMCCLSMNYCLGKHVIRKHRWISLDVIKTINYHIVCTVIALECYWGMIN